MKPLAIFCCAGALLASSFFLISPANGMPMSDQPTGPAPIEEKLAMSNQPVYIPLPKQADLEEQEFRLPLPENSLCMASETAESAFDSGEPPFHWLCSNAVGEYPRLQLADNSPDEFARYHLLRIHKNQPPEGFDAPFLDTEANRKSHRKSLMSRLRTFLAGKPAKDGIYMGLWSRHFNTDTDYHTTGNLVGLQRNGWFYGTFANSHAQQTFLVGVARTLFHKQFTKSFAFHGGYKFGPMYGYNYDGVPNLAGFSVMPLATVGFDYKRLGVDFNMPVGSNSLSMNFRLNWMPFTKKSAQSSP